MKKFKKYQKPAVIAAVITLITSSVLFVYHENHIVNMTEYSVISERLPESFENFTIAQISDFHNTILGNNNDVIIEGVKKNSPDIIVITGDLIDSRKTDVKIATELLENLVKICPVYYVTGNHEKRIPIDYYHLEIEMKRLGVHILRNQSEYIIHQNETIQIIGIDDTSYISDTGDHIPDEEIISLIDNLNDRESYSILLSHRPKYFEAYCQTGVDLVFSGHEHGGQFRIPLIGGVYAPDEGLFPKYSEGMAQKGDTSMITSRGLGQSVFPFRLNNSPELVIAKLHQK